MMHIQVTAHCSTRLRKVSQKKKELTYADDLTILSMDSDIEHVEYVEFDRIFFLD
jgi:hypothetical protein